MKLTFSSTAPGVSMLAAALVLFLFPGSSLAQTNDQRTIVIVVGAAGEPQFGEQFSQWAGLRKQAAAKGGLKTLVVGEEKVRAGQKALVAAGNRKMGLFVLRAVQERVEDAGLPVKGVQELGLGEKTVPVVGLPGGNVVEPHREIAHGPGEPM